MQLSKNIIGISIIILFGIFPPSANSMAGFAEWEIAAPDGYFLGCNDRVPEKCVTLYDQNYQAILSDIEDYRFYSHAIAGSFTRSKAHRKRYFIFETASNSLHYFVEYEELLLALKQRGLRQPIFLKGVLVSGVFGLFPIIILYYFTYNAKKLNWYQYFTALECNFINAFIASSAILTTYLIYSTGSLISFPNSFSVIGLIFKFGKFSIMLLLLPPILKALALIFDKVFPKIPSSISKKVCATLYLVICICILSMAGQLIVKISPYFYEIKNLDNYSIRRGIYITPGT